MIKKKLYQSIACDIPYIKEIYVDRDDASSVYFDYGGGTTKCEHKNGIGRYIRDTYEQAKQCLIEEYDKKVKIAIAHAEEAVAKLEEAVRLQEEVDGDEFDELDMSLCNR